MVQSQNIQIPRSAVLTGSTGRRVSAVAIPRNSDREKSCGCVEVTMHQDRRSRERHPALVGGAVTVTQSYATPSAFPKR